MKLCAAIDQRFRALAGERSAWSTGSMTFEPGAPGIIPGPAEMVFGIRDADLATVPGGHTRMPSAAGHDAKILAR